MSNKHLVDMGEKKQNHILPYFFSVFVFLIILFLWGKFQFFPKLGIFLNSFSSIQKDFNRFIKKAPSFSQFSQRNFNEELRCKAKK